MSVAESWQAQIVETTTREAVQNASGAADFVDSKATWIVSASAGITSIVAGLNAFPQSVSSYSVAEIVTAVGFVACSIIVAVCAAAVWYPRETHGVGCTDFEMVKAAMLNSTEEEAYKFHVDAMCYSLEQNVLVVTDKSTWLSRMSIAFACQIAFLGLLMLAGMLT